MSEALPFTATHVSALATRAAELEMIGEETQDPNALVRAARLYTLAVRIADDMDDREAMPFLESDLTRIRDELRVLAADTATRAMEDEPDGDVEADGLSVAEVTRQFREIALRIEQRLSAG